jgi:hypothetical protein
VLEYASQWDSEEQASNFFAAYRKILQAKWKRCDIATDSPSEIAGTGDNGYFVTRVAGSTVSSVEGLSDPADWRQARGVRPRFAASLRARRPRG